MIRLQGLVPYQDIDIEFIGVRPGEKLFEEILTAEEGNIATKHNRIFVARENRQFSIKDAERVLQTFQAALDQPMFADVTIRSVLRSNVAHYEPETVVTQKTQDGCLPSLEIVR
ncbi:MAG: hypothetical protein A3J72_01710 [Nitrospirae bacterium RIFCSPHIGHO2_02_FULL_40_19]|nr:MAG: hypothetical protein A3J72_01710 [Nitrospirae bacterium RIFCSPHIGHO2_02_FULL_40_19]